MRGAFGGAFRATDEQPILELPSVSLVGVEHDVQIGPTNHWFRLQRFRFKSMLLICGALTLSGCGPSAESHEDEHEQLEHFFPAHKPHSSGELVEQLALRTRQLAAGDQPSDGSDEVHATALQEFSDIIGWIPELAADSELMKADFESAVATGKKLTTAFAETMGPQKTKAVDMATLERLIDELRKLVPKSQAQKERM